MAGARGVIDLLGDVAEFATQAIPGVDGTGVALLQPYKGVPRMQTWAATAEFIHEIDTVQYEELHEGPCVTCMESQRPSVSGSLGSDSRWPHFGGRVAADGGAFRAVAAADRRRSGDRGDQHLRPCPRHVRRACRAAGHSQFAGPAAVSVYNAQLLDGAQERTRGLQRALESRAVIDQAIGIIRSRSGASAEEAFDRLTRLSQTENIKLHIVAERLVEEAVRRARARHRA